MDHTTAFNKAFGLALEAVKSQTGDHPVILSTSGADDVADFITRLTERLEQM